MGTGEERPHANAEAQAATEPYDLVVIGAGSAGLTGAAFARKIGARVALVERHRIGGDCTWTGCVPSKALLKAAKVAHAVRNAAHYGVHAAPPEVDMRRVRAYVRGAIDDVYRHESPGALARLGIDVVEAEARFVDSHTVQAGERLIRGRYFIVCTGARPALPPVPGLGDVPYVTYEQLFDNDRLPRHLVVLGGGPIGLEMAQAYRRLGAAVTVVGEQILPREEDDARAVVEAILATEGISLVRGRATAARREGDETVIDTTAGSARGDLLLVATGRKPNIGGLDLERAGVIHSAKGIPVDANLRTNVSHILAAGDVTGGPQFTHFAGWQCFQAVRNALLPGNARGTSDVVPRVTFLDPEVAHVGLGETEAKARFDDDVVIHRFEMARADRAVCEGEVAGFIKLVARRDGRLLGASIVAAHAGELIGEIALALQHGLRIRDLAATIHAYPTWSTPLQQLASDVAVEQFLTATSGRVALQLGRWFC